MDSSVHANILNADNRYSSKKIWSAITHHFASTEAANRARVFREFFRIKFDADYILDFITKSKTANMSLIDIGVIIPEDINAYMVLENLPTSFDTIFQQITHSNKPINLDLVFDHLKNFVNDSTNKIQQPVKNKFTSMLTTSASIKCKNGWHNPAAPHPEHRCWMLFPNLRPKNTTKNVNFSTLAHPPLNHFVELILNSGSSVHMIHDTTLFVELDQTYQGVIQTSSSKDLLEIRGKGTIILPSENG